MMLIAPANLPVAFEIAVSQGGDSRKRTPSEEISSHEQVQHTETTAIGPIRGINTPQPAFTTCDLPPNLSPSNPHPPSHGQNPFISQGFPIRPVFVSGVSSPMSQQIIWRKRQCVETGPPTMTSLDTIGYNSPILVDSYPFLPEPYEELQDFQDQGVLTTLQAVAEPYE